MLRIILLAAAVALGGCATIDGKQVFLPTASVANPVGVDDLASIKATYAVAASGAAEYIDRYRAGHRCTTARRESLTNLCSRRSIVLRLQAADRAAIAALARAESFIADNPTLNAMSVISLAREAVGAFYAIKQGS